MSDPAPRTPVIMRKSMELDRTRDRLAALDGKIAGPASKKTLKPSLFHRLTHWLDQLYRLKAEELKLLSAIEAAEKRHAMLRREKRLKNATPNTQNLDHDEDESPTPNRRIRWFYIMLLLLMLKPFRNGNDNSPSPN